MIVRHHIFRSATLLLAGLALSCPSLLAQTSSFAPLVKQQRDKVVHISIKAKARPRGRGGPLLPFRFPEPRQGMGSGFIVGAKGLIVTNHHVVAGSGEIVVVLSSGRRYEAQVVGVDSQTDLALLKIDGTQLPVIEFGDSSILEVGDWVLAIGNPLGLDYSVTAGIVSAKGRNIFDLDNLAYGEFIQTDAAINPGNSGGPLFNLKGQVIGVNTAISSRGQGIGFALPSNLVAEVVRQLREHGRVMRGWMGVVIQELNGELALMLGLPERQRGVLVEEIVATGPAAAAGIEEGDVLTRFGGTRLERVPQLQKLVAFSKLGSAVRMTGLRRAMEDSPWEKLRFTVRIGEPPSTAATPDAPLLRRFGLAVREPSQALRQGMGLQPGVGVLVEKVAPRGPAAGTGLREGDVILEANRRQVGSRAEFHKILREARNDRVPLLVKRDRQVLYLVLPNRKP
ncbi:MAG: trypsin-like peptidase domain-containing protein [SAR324 cluster bacterium]|nr:trypsin-like peptidase domain-containing protein [SAR324 cluster bacterium]